MALVGPFSVGYPVDFKSGGDTTRDAFGKHIQEIERIYGYLNALDAGKVSASDVSGLSGSINSLNTALANHINNSNPHPNYKPSVDWSDLIGTKPNLADFNGSLPMSRITGNIDASRINNLPTGGGNEGDGITESKLEPNGYVKFKNGFICQWWRMNSFRFAATNDNKISDNQHVYYEKFLKPFQSACYRMWSSILIPDTSVTISVNDKTSVKIVIDIVDTGVKTIYATDFIAIGV